MHYYSLLTSSSPPPPLRGRLPADSCVLVQSSSPSSKAVSLRQASFASFSVESAPYFRCDVTAVTPPEKWTDDVITFFFRFADEDNEEKLAQLRQKMKQFYTDEKYEDKVSSGQSFIAEEGFLDLNLFSDFFSDSIQVTSQKIGR